MPDTSIVEIKKLGYSEEEVDPIRRCIIMQRNPTKEMD